MNRTELEFELEGEIRAHAIVIKKYEAARGFVKRLAEKNERLKQWVADCQAGMYINCVYCGHRYGPDDKVPCAMADVLKQHIEQCPEHPMSHLKKESEELREALNKLLTYVHTSPCGACDCPEDMDEDRGVERAYHHPECPVGIAEKTLGETQ